MFTDLAFIFFVYLIMFNTVLQQIKSGQVHPTSCVFAHTVASAHAGAKHNLIADLKQHSFTTYILDFKHNRNFFFFLNKVVFSRKSSDRYVSNSVTYSEVFICEGADIQPVPFEKLCWDSVFSSFLDILCLMWTFFSFFSQIRTQQNACSGNDSLSVLAGLRGAIPRQISVWKLQCSILMNASRTSLLLWVFQQENVKYPLPSHSFSPLPFFLPHTRDRQQGRKSSFFAGLNALIKLSDHLGRDKEVMPSASLMLAASALCSTISCRGSTVTGYLTNLALCHCMDDKCSTRVRTSWGLLCTWKNPGEGFENGSSSIKPYDKNKRSYLFHRYWLTELHDPADLMETGGGWPCEFFTDILKSHNLSVKPAKVFHSDFHLKKQSQACCGWMYTSQNKDRPIKYNHTEKVAVFQASMLEALS